jgi:hypothetical protein
MALENRDKATNEQIVDFPCVVLGNSPVAASAGLVQPGIANGLTWPLFTVPYPAQLLQAGASYWGTSGSPSHSLWVYRFAGGFTSIQVGASLAVTAYGTSGYQGFSILPASTSFPLQAGDVVALYSLGGSSAAVASATITLCIQALQDVKTHFGGSV